MSSTVLDIPSVREQVSPEEWQVRCDLAACYRLVALFGWDDLIFTHISARVPGAPDHFLINPYGLFFEEITASSLVKVDHHCEPVLPTAFPVNPAGFIIHSAVHEARAEAQCVLHTHSLHGIAVSALDEGLQPLAQSSLFPMSSLAYHDYEGIAVRPDEKARLVEHLGNANNLILRNHGLLTVGRSVADAFVNMYFLETACRVQIMARSAGTPRPVTREVMADIPAQAREVTKGQGGAALTWPGLLRRLERRNPGYDR